MSAKTQRLTHSLLFLSMSTAIHATAYAQQNTSLDAIDVMGSEEIEETGKSQITRKKLDRQMVQDERDLVRYDPGISVVEGGRAGSNGFAIRGVDKDRIAINIDGLSQAESRSSQGFQELFGAYGNYNTNRNAAELENISEVTVLKGADSITAGSGALGGAVLYRTKSASDYLTEDKDYYANFKGGYTSKNRQKIGSLTLAGKLGKVDALTVFTSRSGNELKNFSQSEDTLAVDYYDDNYKRHEGIIRENPDPQHVSSKSGLIKFGYQINNNNRISAIYEDYRQDRHTDERSNIFAGWNSNELRRRNDVSYRRRSGIEYENISESGPWDRMRFNFDRQKIKMTTLTWDLPKDYSKKGKNLEVYMSRRGLNQAVDQASFAAEKYLDWDSTFWDIYYGAGLGKNTNSNDNKTFYTYAYRPNVLSTNENNSENFIGAESRFANLYWNNRVNWQDKYTFSAGVRYDHYKMKTLPDDNFNRGVGAPGLEDAKGNFHAVSYSVGADWHITPAFTLQSKYSTGFRAPTTDELWFNFNHPDFSVRYNPDLKAEHAKNVELGFDWHGDWGNVRLSGFQTKYKDFIDFAYIGGKPIRFWNYQDKKWDESSGLTAPTYQNVNRQSATVRGIELRSHWNLNSIGLAKGLYSDVSASYNKGKSDGDQPMNAIQPFNAVLSLGYNQPDDRWSLATNLSYFARKKPQDTMHNSEHPDEAWPYVDHSRSVWLLDATGKYQISKNFVLRAGVFNIFNQQYYTWNSLRSIREFGAVNRVSSDTENTGIKRFSAPGRNYSIMFEAKF